MTEREKSRHPSTPPAHRGTLPETIKVHPGKGLTAIILSPKVTGVWTHWVGQRSLPCNSRDAAHCLVDHRVSGRYRWQGWMAVHPIGAHSPGFLGLTEGCVKANPYLRISKTLRGATINAWRAGDHKESKMLVRISASGPARADLLLPPSTAEFLCRLWNIPWLGKLPEGVEGWPAEQEELRFDGGPTIDHIQDPLKGTIWEGQELDQVVEGAEGKAKEIWQRMRREGQL